VHFFVRSGNVTVFVPLATGLVLSIVLAVVADLGAAAAQRLAVPWARSA